MHQLGYRIVATKPEGRQWTTVQSVEAAIRECVRLGWTPEEVELFNLYGREDEPELTLWSSEGGQPFSEVLRGATQTS